MLSYFLTIKSKHFKSSNEVVADISNNKNKVLTLPSSTKDTTDPQIYQSEYSKAARTTTESHIPMDAALLEKHGEKSRKRENWLISKSGTKPHHHSI